MPSESFMIFISPHSTRQWHPCSLNTTQSMRAICLSVSILRRPGKRRRLLNYPGNQSPPFYHSLITSLMIRLRRLTPENCKQRMWWALCLSSLFVLPPLASLEHRCSRFSSAQKKSACGSCLVRQRYSFSPYCSNQLSIYSWPRVCSPRRLLCQLVTAGLQDIHITLHFPFP